MNFAHWTVVIRLDRHPMRESSARNIASYKSHDDDRLFLYFWSSVTVTSVNIFFCVESLFISSRGGKGRKVSPGDSDTVGRSGEFLFVDQSNFFLNNYADRQPSSRNTHQEYSFHLYSGGTSPPKQCSKLRLKRSHMRPKLWFCDLIWGKSQNCERNSKPPLSPFLFGQESFIVFTPTLFRESTSCRM